jgi:V/A-type H+/Na+-transporting ATPase subunit G/H
MTLDAMTQVTQAEAQAKSSMQDASTASKQIIADAGAKGKAYQAEKEAQAAAAVKEMMRNAEAKAAENAEEIMHHAENQCAVLRAHAESRLDAAANSIVERIVID